MTEKREFFRINSIFPVEIKTGKSPSEIVSSFRGNTIDIGRGGVSLKSKERFPVSSSVLLDINLFPELPVLTSEAKIIWRNSSNDDGYSNYGLRFTGIKAEGDIILRRLLGYEVDHIVTASYLPEKIVSNEDIVKMGFKGSSKTLERGLGAKERRAAATDETNADMLFKVAKKILDKAGVLPGELDRIICAAEPCDSAAPDTSCAVQGKLGAVCPAFGISMSCTGWVAGMDIALGCLDRGEKNILVLAGSRVGSTLYYYNLMHRAIFGDGAGGILLQSHHRERFLASGLWTLGQYYSKIFVPYRWSKVPEEIPVEYKDSFYMSDDQKMFFDVMDCSSFLPFANSILDKAKVKKDDIDLFLLHYASKPLYEHFLKSFDIRREKTFVRFSHQGNTVAAEMPILLDGAISAGRIKKNNLIFIFTYGAGFTAGGLVFRY